MRRSGGLLATALVAVSLTVVVAGPARAATPWKFTGPPGGSVEAIAVAPSNPSTVYATLDDRVGDESVSKSTDGGLHWSDAGNGLMTFDIAGLAVDPANPDRVFLASIDGVHRTTNGGGMWTLPSTDLNGTVVTGMAIDPGDADVLYAATQNDGVWKSTDGATSWKHKSSGLPASIVRTIAISASNPHVLYAATDAGVYTSTDAAASWTKMNGGLPGTAFALAIDPTHPHRAFAGTDTGVFHTTNGGGHWAASSSGIPAGDRDVTALLVDPHHAARVYAGSDGGGVFASTNSGGSWVARNSGLAYLQPLTLALDPTNPAVVFAGTLGGVYRSTNHALSWKADKSGLRGTDANVVAVDPTNASIAYEGAEGGGFLKTVDGGKHWTPHNPLDPGGALVREIAVDPHHPHTVYMAGLLDHSVAKSTDGGITFHFQPSAKLLNVTEIEVSLSNSKVVWACGSSDGVWRTIDGGAHWNHRSNGLTGTIVVDVAVSPSNAKVAYAADVNGNGVFKTSNGGGSWNPAHTGMTDLHANALAIDPADPTHVLVGTQGGVFETTNGGGSWSPKDAGFTGTPDVLSLEFDPHQPATVYAGLFGFGVFRSTDGSDNWSDFNTAIPPDGQSRRVQGIAVSSNGHTLYAATARGVFRRSV